MIKIWYEDIDWVSYDGKVIKMSLGNEMYINTRFTYNYTPPIITEDTWNGKTFPVQINIWESYIIEFGTKEQSIHAISKMQACQKVWIEDTETNEIIQVDNTSSGSLAVELGERFLSANQSYNLVVKTKKIPTYPGIARENTNVLQIIVDAVTYIFYSDKDVINFISDAEQINYSNGSGINETAKTVAKFGSRMVFYLMESDALSLKEKAENLGYTTIIINPLTDNIQAVEIGICKLTALPEGLYKCEVELITNSSVNYA